MSAEAAASSARLRLLRVYLGLSQEELASRLGMRLRAYREWERPGRRKWYRIGFAMQVCEVTGCSLLWLLYDGQLGPSSPLPLGYDNKSPLPAPGSIARRLARDRSLLTPLNHLDPTPPKR